MHFPVYFSLFGLRVHAHQLMELIGYTGGFQLYVLLRKRWGRLAGPVVAVPVVAVPPPSGPAIPVEQNLWLLVGCVFGALLGSKLLAWLESPLDYFPHWRNPAMWMGGKTIVGGLLGGWAGVEVAKKRRGLTRSTGDPFVFPLVFGMSVGRIGCFLTGLEDHTHGVHTSLPWGVDFGDGPRHPTQLYDILFLLSLAGVLRWRMRRPYESGRLFRLFLFGYLAWRFAVEFIKPRYNPYLGLSAIQLACLAGMALLARMLWRGRAARNEPSALGVRSN